MYGRIKIFRPWTASVSARRSAASSRLIVALLAPQGTAYLSVSRKLPAAGKLGIRKRIQNYVVLTLPSVFRDGELEVYRLEPGSTFEDLTQEIEDRL